MGFAASLGRGCVGIGAPQVIVEVHTTTGLPGFSIVGLPETTVRESKERVRSAIINSGFEFPRRRITVNLAPAELPKPGTRFDLAIAVAIVAASGQIDGRELASHTLYAELGLDGTLRPVIGALPAALACRDAHQALILAHDNAEEAALVSTCVVLGAGTLLEVIEHLTGAQRLSPRPPPPGSKADAASLPSIANDPIAPDLSDVRGQDRAKRALEIAAAGGHNLLFIGPPGTGKTMLANRLPGLLPRLSDQHALELAAVLSVAGRRFDPFRWREPPFRAPHHSCSSVALIGGGVRPQPGEISLAHRGVLFLDELPEFTRPALEALRQPLESGELTIARGYESATYPARGMVVLAANPCP
ncbi:MAG: YifB family Mg chelatase-like AAA ATPase, partial [Gammaproteobacteria bacterium]|nr:YifB family Mg chelatase-like AAA ATPase [Gammaproteobacteria bacterium]